MSQNFEAFRQAVNHDSDLQKEVAELIERTKGIDFGAISELAGRHDYVFSPQEAQSLLGSEDELSDFELEMVAAGSISCDSGVAATRG